MAGQLIIGSTLTIEGNVSFRLELAGANPGVELIVNGTIALAPIGSLQLIDSGFRINAQGLVARVQIALDASAGFGAGVNLKLSGSAVVAINTTGVAQTFGGSSVAPGFLLRIDGTVEFLGFATASGFVEISIGSSGFQMLFNVDFSFAGTLRFHLGGGAGVYTEAGHSGIALALNVSVEAGGAGQVFEIKASGTFNLNTTNVTRIGIAANTFLLNVSGKISVLKVITFDASMTILVSGNKWQFEADARMDFFGIATLDGHVLIKSNGDFSISLHGGMTIGSSDFGLRGDFNFYVTSLHNDTTGTYRFDLGGSASVKVRAFGITLAGVGLSFHFGFDTAGINQDGRVEIVLEVGIHVDLFLFSIDETARFSIGWLQFPPPIHLAGGTTPAVWGSTEHDLVLNVGSRAGSRGIATTDTVENVIVRQVGGTASDATIEVVMFGRTQQFAHVSSVTGNFGAGRDNVVIDGSVLVPVFIYGEGDNDVISFAGQGAATLSGGSDTVPTSPSTDNDYISASGPGTITMSGGAGNDVLIHTGTGKATIHGNAGADALTGSSATDELYGDDDNDRLDGVAARFDGGAGNDLLYVTVPSGALPTIIGGDETSGTDVDSLFLTLGGGADTLDVASSAAKSLSLTLNGQPAKTATGLEKMFVDGRAGADRFTVQALTSTSGLSEITFDAGRTVTVNGTRTESYTINGVVFTREVPDTRTSFDNAADIVTIIGTSGDDSYLLTNTTRNCLGEDTTSETKCAVAKMTKIHRAGFDVFVGQTVRSEGDGVVVLAGDGNDILDARGLTTGDELKVTLKGQNGSDHLYGTPYDDALDGGLGSDFFTGGTGTDTFDDASAAGGGDIDTLVETNDLDMGLYDDLFVVGHVSGTDWQTGATVEDLKGLFEAAVLTGGDSGNTFLVGDDDGSVVLGATRRAVRSWHGDATLTTKAGNDLVRVALNGANGARVHVTDGGGTDRLEVWGTALRENVLVDTLDGRGRVRTRAANTTTADAGTDATDLVSIDHSGVELVEIRTLGGGDRIGVRAIDVEHRIFTGSGDDTVAVGSNAGVGATLVGWPNALGNVNAIAAKLTLDGGDGGSSAANGFDQLVVDDSGDTAGNTGSQTGSTITGLGMAVGITYTGFATLAVQLGSGGDTYTVDDSHTGSSRPTYLSTGDGADLVIIRSVHGRLEADLGGGDDIVRISSTSTGTGGNLNGILSSIKLTGGDGTDTLYVDDTATGSTDRIGRATDHSVEGLGTTVGGSVEQASQLQVVSVRNATTGRFSLTVGGRTTQLLDFDAAPTTVQAALQSALEAAKSLAAGALGGAVTVSKAGTSWIVSYQGLLAGAVGRALDITVNTETLNAGSVVGVTRMSDGRIDFTDFQVTNIALGAGNDVLDVDSTVVGTTSVSTGAGDDRVALESTAGPTTILAGAGDDWLLVNPVQPGGETNTLLGRVTLDGQAGSDYYLVSMFGNGGSRIDVADSVTGVGSGTNVLVVNGSAANDTFLLRKGLVAQLSNRSSAGWFQAAEKVTYTDGVNGGVLVNGLDGDDAFALDDNSSSMTIDGGNGNDIFQIGQLFTAYRQTAGLDEWTVPSTDFADTTRRSAQQRRVQPDDDQRRLRRRHLRGLPQRGVPPAQRRRRRRHLHRPDLPAASPRPRAVATGGGRDLVQYVAQRTGRDRRRRGLRHGDRGRHRDRRHLRRHRRRHLRRRPLRLLRQHRAPRGRRPGGRRHLLRPVHQPGRRDPDRRRPGQRPDRGRGQRAERPGRRLPRLQRHHAQHGRVHDVARLDERPGRRRRRGDRRRRRPRSRVDAGGGQRRGHPGRGRGRQEGLDGPAGQGPERGGDGRADLHRPRGRPDEPPPRPGPRAEPRRHDLADHGDAVLQRHHLDRASGHLGPCHRRAVLRGRALLRRAEPGRGDHGWHPRLRLLRRPAGGQHRGAGARRRPGRRHDRGPAGRAARRRGHHVRQHRCDRDLPGAAQPQPGRRNLGPAHLGRPGEVHLARRHQQRHGARADLRGRQLPPSSRASRCGRRRTVSSRAATSPTSRPR